MTQACRCVGRKKLESETERGAYIMMGFLQTGKALYVLAVICFGGIFVRLMAGSFYTVSYTHLTLPTKA